jgi:hypothetical protein
MLQTIITIERPETGYVVVSIGVREWTHGRRTPRTVRRPWQHIVHLPDEVTDDEVFGALRSALTVLTMLHPVRSPEGSPGAP